MIYHSFKGETLSALGFGLMRLPTLENGEIDQVTFDRMIDRAIEAGVNYFDTAYPYHNGKSELAAGKSLARYPREKWLLADKFPGHQNVRGVTPLDPEEIFEEQIQKTGVEYFDFYLLHNINENSMYYYGNPENRWLEYFLRQKEKGRIRHLGFSTHATPETLEKFLSAYGTEMEFCQIQLNFVDWKLQQAKEKVELLEKAGIPIWVMEPLRGGKLASYTSETEEKLRTLRPDESIASWALRWLQSVPKPTLVLSGMSNPAQLEDNLKTFSDEKPLSGEETALLYEIADSLADFIPCTACRYCTKGCPMKLDIPALLNMANDLSMASSINISARYSSLGDGKRASDCIACGRCATICPQRIAIPQELHKFAEKMKKERTWEEICAERAAAAAALKAAQS